MSLFKTSLGLLLSLSCTIASAADDSRVRRSLDEIAAAQEQSKILMNSATTSEQKERVRYIQGRLTTARELLEDALGGNGGYTPTPPPPSSSGAVELFHSDSCSGTLIGTAGPGTNCKKFEGAGAAWGVRINGQCLNIQDTSAVDACESFKGGAVPNATKIYHSDSCSGEPLAAVSMGSSCELLEQNGTAAWAVKVGNTCYNIQDTAPAKACESFKSASNPAAIQIFHSDSCSGEMVAAVDGYTRCDNLRGLPDAWAIKINGRCENISDVKIEQACERYR